MVTDALQVLFPELGLDIVERRQGEEGEGEGEGEGQYSITLSTNSWEDNWLFRRGE